MPGFQTTTTYYNPSLNGVPVGATSPSTATPLVAVSFSENVTFTEAKVGIVGADKVVAFDAMVTAIDTAVQSWISTTLSIDIATADVDYNAEIFAYADVVSADEVWLNDASSNFYIEVNIKVRVY